jgi:hypothetical protein
LYQVDGKVSSPVVAGACLAFAKPGRMPRIPAAEIDTLVIGTIRSRVNSCPTDAADRAVLERYCEKVVIKQGSAELFLRNATDGQMSSISLPWAPQPSQRKRAIIFFSAKSDQPARPIRADRPHLLELLSLQRNHIIALRCRRAGAVHSIISGQTIPGQSRPLSAVTPIADRLRGD